MTSTSSSSLFALGLLSWLALTFVQKQVATEPECTRLMRTSYVVYHGNSVTLECPKRCHTYAWMHNGGVYSQFFLKDVPFLHVSLKFGRRRGGFYCCRCISSPLHEQCCFGVAIFPTVKHFSIRQLQVENGSRHNIEGVHFQSSIEIKCSVTGYPWPALTISGPTDTASRLIANSSHENDTDMHFRNVIVHIPADKVTSVFSGNFSCVGEITIVQDGNLQDTLESVPKIHKLIIYEIPRIVSSSCKDSRQELKLTCGVNSTIPYNLQWLFQGKNITSLNESSGRYLTSSNGSKHWLLVKEPTTIDLNHNYTCIVSTSFQEREAAKTFHCGEDTYPEGHHPKDNMPAIAGGISIVILILTFVAMILMILSAVWCYRKCCSRTSYWRPPRIINVAAAGIDDGTQTLMSSPAEDGQLAPGTKNSIYGVIGNLRKRVGS